MGKTCNSWLSWCSQLIGSVSEMCNIQNIVSGHVNRNIRSCFIPLDLILTSCTLESSSEHLAISWIYVCIVELRLSSLEAHDEECLYTIKVWQILQHKVSTRSVLLRSYLLEQNLRKEHHPVWKWYWQCSEQWFWVQACLLCCSSCFSVAPLYSSLIFLCSKVTVMGTSEISVERQEAVRRTEVWDLDLIFWTLQKRLDFLAYCIYFGWFYFIVLAKKEIC